MPLFGRLDIGKLEQKRDIKELIKILKQGDNSLREGAEEALGRIGEQAIVPLINELRILPFNGTIEISYMTVALGKIGEPAIEPLIAAIRENNPCLRVNATVALGYIGEPAVSPLIKLLLDPDGNVRGLATAALARIGEPAVEPLLKVLTDSRVEVRLGAVVAIGPICDRRAIEPLRRALGDDNRWVRLHSAGALTKIDTSEIQAVKLLREAAQDYGPDSSDDYRGVAALLLKQISPAQS